MGYSTFTKPNATKMFCASYFNYNLLSVDSIFTPQFYFLVTNYYIFITILMRFNALTKSLILSKYL